MAILNWLPNAGFNKETRFFTTQDIAEGAEKIQTADKAIRDIKRKRAIEKATAEAIDAKGELNQEALRQSLKNAGFGEDAEATINKITSERNAKLDENIKLRKSLGEMVALNLIDNDKANMILEGVMKQSQTQSPPDSKAVAGSPGAATSTTPSTTQFPQTQIPQTPSVGVPSTTSQQFSPDYVKLGPADFGKYAGSTPTIEPVKIEFSSDPTLRQKQIRAAEQTLSIKIPSNITDADLNALVNKRADDLAVSQNQIKPPAAFAGDLAKIRSHETEVASARAKTKADIISALSGQINTGRQLTTGERQATTSEKSQKLTEEKATIPGFRFKSDPSIILDISKQTAQAEEAGKLANELKGMKTTDPGYKGKSMTLAKTLIQAKGLGVSEGVLQSMTDQMGGAGFDIGKFIKQNASTLSDAGQNFLREFYRSQTTGNVNFIDMVKDVQRANRTFLYSLGPTDLEQFVELTPILGESNAEKQKWIDSKQKPKTARESLERKKKEGKKTSSAEGF